MILATIMYKTIYVDRTPTYEVTIRDIYPPHHGL